MKDIFIMLKERDTIQLQQNTLACHGVPIVQFSVTDLVVWGSVFVLPPGSGSGSAKQKLGSKTLLLYL
jgi:hypothetical protein